MYRNTSAKVPITTQAINALRTRRWIVFHIYTDSSQVLIVVIVCKTLDLINLGLFPVKCQSRAAVQSLYSNPKTSNHAGGSIGVISKKLDHLFFG